MSTQPARRRRRGSGFVHVSYSIDPKCRDLLREQAQEAGIAVSVLLDRLIQNEAETGEVRRKLRNEADPQEERLPMTG